MSIMMPLPNALPTSPVPAPRGVTGILYFFANRMILIMSNLLRGMTITDGFNRYELESTE